LTEIAPVFEFWIALSKMFSSTLVGAARSVVGLGFMLIAINVAAFSAFVIFSAKVLRPLPEVAEARFCVVSAK
jgi:hypothetical protein